MCHCIKIINEIKGKHLSKCEECNMYYLTFNNVFFEFTSDEFESFKKFISLIKDDYCKYPCSNRIKKIPIPTQQQNLILMFDKQEVEDLKTLIFNRNSNPYKTLRLDEIDYTLFLN